MILYQQVYYPRPVFLHLKREDSSSGYFENHGG